ncbi:MAG: ABC transporter permease subunit [Deltaproteobacteria bacterium]|nr:ABC transporter permease subunit [Deltaproteobacteria bacterium]
MRFTVLVALVALQACASPRQVHGTLARIRARGELTWAGDIQGGEPYVFEDPHDPSHLIGFEVEVADAIARQLGVRARFVQFAWSNLVPSLERGDFDVALNGLEETPERQDRILLSRPYFIYAETLAVRSGSPYRSLSDLHGKRVATLNQTHAHDLLRERPIDVVLYEGVEEPYLDLVAGRVDAVLLDHIIADRYGCPVKGVECLPGEVARGAYVIGMRKGDHDLKAAIDDALARMKETGELRRILEKWHLWDARQEQPTAATGATMTSGLRGSYGRQQVHLFLRGAAVTLGLSVGAFALAVPLGLVLAIARVHGGTMLRVASAGYVEVFRGTPVLLQLYLLYYGMADVFRLGAVSAAILGLGLNYAAYEAEIYRGALLALPRGQSEAAQALGFTTWQALRHVLLPQSLRTALPAMTNDFVALLKDSSLVSVITVVELTKRMTIAAVDLRGWLMPGLACAGLYFVMSFPLSRLSRHLEKRLARDQHPRTA